MNEIQVLSTLTLGNILTMATIIGAIVLNIVMVTNKLTKFIAITEMKFQSGNEKFAINDTKHTMLESCIKGFVPKIEIDKLEDKVLTMKDRQTELRAELPDKEWYRTIDMKLTHLQTDVQQIKEQVFKK